MRLTIQFLKLKNAPQYLNTSTGRAGAQSLNILKYIEIENQDFEYQKFIFVKYVTKHLQVLLDYGITTSMYMEQKLS